MKEQIVCRVLTGPTASGKSSIGIRMAREEGWAIFCMDSMQIYRRMDIGTAKPTTEEREAVPHYMLDICEPTECYSVSQYIERAEKEVIRQHEKGRKVLFVGGTGLYLEGMLRGMRMGSVPANGMLRAELRRMAESEEGRRQLDRRLRECDPETAEKLPMNDIRRRIRAIEVSETTGIPFSRQEERKTEETDRSPFRWKIVSTQTERSILYDRINRRVSGMIRNGLAEEVSALLQEGVPDDAQSMQAIGYKEMVPFLRGAYSLETAAEEIRKRTRHYAKRQETFLKRITEIRYADTLDPGVYEKIREFFLGDGDETDE